MEFRDIVGKVFVSVMQIDDARNGDSIIFTESSTGKEYVLYHSQDCCESVRVEDIVGDLKDLCNTPILEASEDSNVESDEIKWTYYRIRTIKGTVSIRWYGESNGYYSTSVSFDER